jgi:hypothetical protein
MIFIRKFEILMTAPDYVLEVSAGQENICVLLSARATE